MVCNFLLVSTFALRIIQGGTEQVTAVHMESSTVINSDARITLFRVPTVVNLLPHPVLCPMKDQEAYFVFYFQCSRAVHLHGDFLGSRVGRNLLCGRQGLMLSCGSFLIAFAFLWKPV